MAPHAVCTLKEVDPSTLELLHRLFGRELSADQRVLFTLLETNGSTAEAKRQEAWGTINRILNQAEANMKEMSEEEFEKAVDEAMVNVRPRRNP